MAFEIAIKATEKEIQRLEKRKQAVLDNINKSRQPDVLFGKRLDLSRKKGQLQQAIEFHTIGIEKLSARKLTVIKAELASVKKEGAEVEKLLNMDTFKEAEKMTCIDIQIHDLSCELQRLSWMARH